MVFVKRFLFNLLIIVCMLASVVITSKLDTAVNRRPPGLKSPAKAWWAKEITPDFHVAGRLTERQIKYASEAGFRSILSLFMYETDDGGSFGGEYLPTSAEAWAVSHLAGMQYVALLGSDGDWGSVKTVQLFADVLPNLRRPILLHCDRGYTITFVTLMHMANQTRYNSSFEPRIYSDNFYRIVAAMGLDFTHDDLREVVANITGESVVANPLKPNCKPEQWLDFWLAHPVYGNWYTAGQIRKCDVKVLEATGFKAIVNMRVGLTYNNVSSQEQVTLLNIKDSPTTYGNASVPPRQDLITLENNRINPHLGSNYISEKSKLNFDTENLAEFGDDIGYNEELEREFVSKSSIKYYHIPISPNANLTAELFSEIQETLLEAGQHGPVLVHCRSGRRVAYLGVLAAAVEQGFDREWAFKRLRELGFEASPEVKSDVYKMFCETLQSDGAYSIKEEL